MIQFICAEPGQNEVLTKSVSYAKNVPQGYRQPLQRL